MLTSCKPKEYTVDYTVDNRSFESIFVIIQKTDQSSLDTNLISSSQRFTFHIEMGEGETAEDYIFGLDQFPFHFFQVQNEFGNEMLCDEMNLSCWSRLQNQSAKKSGSILLNIHQNSF